MRIGLIGSHGHTNLHLAGFIRSARVSAVILAEADEACRETLRRRYGLIQETHSDWAALLADDSVEVVDVALPPAQRPAVIRQALRAGKHVLCEGLPATEVAACRELLGEAGGLGRQLIPCLPQRFLPAVIRAKQMLAEKAIGPVQLASLLQVTPLLDADAEGVPDGLWEDDVLFGACDLVGHLLGPVAQVQALGSGSTQLAALRLEAGGVAQVSVARQEAEMAFVSERRLIGEAGMLLIRDNSEDEAPLLWWQGPDVSLVRVRNPLDAVEFSVLQAVVDCLEKLHQGAPATASGEAVLGAVGVCQALRLSAAEGRAVSVTDVLSG